MAVAVTAVRIHGAKYLVAVGDHTSAGINHRFGLGTGAGLMQVLVMAQVSGTGLGLVPAVRRDGRPAELERQQAEQENCEEAAHGREYSDYRPRPSIDGVNGE